MGELLHRRWSCACAPLLHAPALHIAEFMFIALDKIICCITASCCNIWINRFIFPSKAEKSSDSYKDRQNVRYRANRYVLGLSSKKKSNNHAIIYIACFTVKCNLLLLYHCFYIHPKLEMSAQTIRFKSLYSPLEVVNV